MSEFACVHCGTRSTERVRSCCLQAVSRRGTLPKQTNQRKGGSGQRTGQGGGAWFHATGLINHPPKWRLPHQGTKGRG